MKAQAKPDISALDLAFGWSSEFGSRPVEVGSDDELVSAVAKSVRHEGLFEHYYDDLVGYLKHFAPYGWDAGADRQAEAYLQKYIEEMRLHYAGKDELWKGLALGATEPTRKDLANDRLESAVAVNIVTKEVIFRRYGDEDETPLQEENRAMIKDPHNTALVHNHWNDSPASQADFDTTLWLGVRYLIVVTPSGRQYLYERDGDRMKLLDEIFNREHVALPSPAETAESRAAYEAQVLAEAGNPAEIVMRQDDIADRNGTEAPTEAGALAQRAILENEYGVILTSQRAIAANTIDGWSYQAIDSAYKGVRESADAMWTVRDRLDPYARPQDSASLFRAVVGPLKIRLAPPGPDHYAETFAAEIAPDGTYDNTYNVIEFYRPDWEDRGDWFKFNLVHEIGHVISNRVPKYHARKVNLLNDQFDYDPHFKEQGWGQASGRNWIEERQDIWNNPDTPVVTRQFDPEEEDPSYRVNEAWADMFLFWVYDDRAGQVTFGDSSSDDSLPREPASKEYTTYGEVRRLFMQRNMPNMINARYRIGLSPEEIIDVTGWGDPDSALLPRVTPREDLFADAEMRINLEGAVNLDVWNINENPAIVAGKLRLGEMTTILGRSSSYPHMVLNMSEEGEIRWTHIGLLDLSGVDADKLLPLSDKAILELQGLDE